MKSSTKDKVEGCCQGGDGQAEGKGWGSHG